MFTQAGIHRDAKPQDAIVTTSIRQIVIINEKQHVQKKNIYIYRCFSPKGEPTINTAQEGVMLLAHFATGFLRHSSLRWSVVRTPSASCSESGSNLDGLKHGIYRKGYVGYVQITYSGWWFQIFFIFIPIWGRFPFWLIFFKGVETTN